MGTVKIKSTNKATQGDFVVIDESEFDETKHEKLTDKQDAAASAKTATADAKAAAKDEAK